MLILACDTTSSTLGLALLQDGEARAEWTQHCDRTHSEVFLPAVTNLLEQAGCAIGDIGLFAVADGPGSYTGIRIGLAAVGALAWAGQKPVYGVSVLEALAWPWLGVPDSLVCAQIDARNRRRFCAAWQRGSVALAEGNRSQSDWTADVLDLAAQKPHGCLIWTGVSDSPEDQMDFRAKLRECAPAWQMIVTPDRVGPHPLDLARIAWQRHLAGDPGDPAGLSARYISLSAAARLQHEQNGEKET